VQLVAAAALDIAQTPEKPEYLETKSGQFGGGGGDRPYFGSIPDFAQEQPGYGLMGVTKGSPAEKAGIRGGDVMVRFGESRIGNLADFDSALRKYKSGDKVPVVLKRGEGEVTVEVILDPPK
jgi:S1-C subfamily serine protease